MSKILYHSKSFKIEINNIKLLKLIFYFIEILNTIEISNGILLPKWHLNLEDKNKQQMRLHVTIIYKNANLSKL